MPTPRRRQVCLDVTPFYHCVTRCVRQAFLCGFNKFTNTSADHRRNWIEDRLLLLNEVFCIQVVGYAVMSNHYHVVLKVDRELANQLNRDETIGRWLRLYKGPELMQRYAKGESLSQVELQKLDKIVANCKAELHSISRFMGNLNEHIARRSNSEDQCTGRFWESRFKLQAILDLPALLRTLCYVDLNPVRAKVAETPEKSQHTSIKRRLEKPAHGLMSFRRNNSIGSKKENHVKREVPIEHEIPIPFQAYLDLLDWTGRQLKTNKRGRIAAQAAPIIERIGYTAEQWIAGQQPHKGWTQRALGNAKAIRAYCKAIDQKWIWKRST